MKLGPKEPYDPNNPDHKDSTKYQVVEYESTGKGADKVEVGVSFKSDVSRRDFKINSMGIDSDGNIIDYFDGVKDIKNKLISTVGDPDQRFSEDYIRMLRATRFASRLGFNIDKDTTDSIKKFAVKIKNIAPERIMKEVLKMAAQEGTKFADAILLLDKVGLLQHIFPEVVKMKEFEHSADTHPEGGVFPHVLAALRSNKLKDPIINLSILFHDLGKTTSRTYENGKVRYLNHAKNGADLIDKIADRMKLDNKTRKALVFSALNHMKMHELTKMSNNKIFDMMQNDNWDVLVNVAMADSKARGKMFKEKEWKEIEDKIAVLTKRYKDKKSQDAIKKVVNGNLVMKLLNMKPGPKLGEVIKGTMEWILDNNINIKDTKKINTYILDNYGK